MNSPDPSPAASPEFSPAASTEFCPADSSAVSSEFSPELSPIVTPQPTACEEASSASRLLTCRACGRQLPAESFELYKTGTRRRVCRQCKYQLYGKAAKSRWRYKQLSMTFYEKATRFSRAP